MSPTRPRLFLVDTFGLIFRAFYGRARSPLPGLRTAAGLPTEAVYVFNNMLKRLIEDYDPDYLVAVWEGHGPTFREKIFPEYKANREEMPADLATQLPYIGELLQCWNIEVATEDGYEADDTIALLARQAAEHDLETWIVSADKDLMQLVGNDVIQLNPMKDERYGPADVKQFLGVEPDRVTDYLALMGDSVDNIPGAPGIGKKGAEQLIDEFGDIEDIIRHAGEVKRKAYRESLENHADQIRLSKHLATLDTSGSLRLDLEAVKQRPPDTQQLIALYRKLEFKSLAVQLEAGAATAEAEASVRAFESAEQFAEWTKGASGPLAIAVAQAPAQEPVIGECGGIGFASRDGELRLLPADFTQHAKELFASEDQDFWVHDWKSAIHSLDSMGVDFPNASDDTMLMAFLVDSSRTNYSIEKTVERRLGTIWKPNAGVSAGQVRQLREQLRREIDEAKLTNLYETIELPLAPVLARMEAAGVLLDPSVLTDLSARLEHRIEDLGREIHDLAGRTFNIGSPKQLGEILYDHLGLRAPRKRGKTKALSTASDILESLANDHPVPLKVLEWRQHSKLKNTYVDVLPELVGTDGRLHTTFNPTGSATGRLSSLNPNLQNIPARTELGREIRKAFVAAEGTTFLAADYSQIELRVLAHMSGDPKLVAAFQSGDDIHTLTASEVLDIDPALVGPEERYRAKAVNFGIIYGLSAFGLAKQLGIPQRHAKDYIDLYFERYGTIKDFIARTIERTKEIGFSQTMFGRRRPVTDLESKNSMARGLAERIAVNSPIQGTAADLIKKAMVSTDNAIRTAGFGARMLLQVHDELVLEVPHAEVRAVGRLLKEEMEGAAQLDVPLVADIKSGPNWRDMLPIE
ncbi:MAG: DNA polymerase I [Bryobacterales bacterium]|nr:DNA polymerase I [Bryobacterales bacterium]